MADHVRVGRSVANAAVCHSGSREYFCNFRRNDVLVVIRFVNGILLAGYLMVYRIDSAKYSVERKRVGRYEMADGKAAEKAERIYGNGLGETEREE